MSSFCHGTTENTPKRLLVRQLVQSYSPIIGWKQQGDTLWLGSLFNRSIKTFLLASKTFHKYRIKRLYVDCGLDWFNSMLTLTLPGPSASVSGSLDSYCSLKPLYSGMGEVVPARTLPTLLPPSPRTVLSLSCFRVSQCINCRDWHCKS